MQRPGILSKVPIRTLQAYTGAGITFKGKLLAHDTREWLETAGMGSYAGSTVSGANTRNYHGLLVASENPPIDRNVLLQRIDEEVDIDGEKSQLSEVAYGNTKLKQGGDSGEEISNIKSFTVLPVPTWKYDLGQGKSIKKQVAMPNNGSRGTTVVGYTYNAPKDASPITLTLKPLMNYRSFHGGYNNIEQWNQQKSGNKLKLSCTFNDKNSKSVYMAWDKNSAKYAPTNYKYDNYYYQREDERGCNKNEGNVNNPGEIKITLKPNESFSLTSSIDPIKKPLDIKTTVVKKEERLEQLLDKAQLPKTNDFKMLVRAADQFVVHRQSTNSPTIIAGYHWFNDWGRDTMISLPGLTLTTKRFDDAKGILTTFAKYSKNGMLPNNFPDSNGAIPGYNTIDASMYWFNALNSYIKESKVDPKKDPFVRSQYKELKKVVQHHMYGRHSAEELLGENFKLRSIVNPKQEKLFVGNGEKGIGMESDGLIAADDPQLTWMDAAIWKDGKLVAQTPREGKAVEINALWYNGLRIMQGLANKFGEKEEEQEYGQLADMVKGSMKQFWNKDKNCLYDLIGLDIGGITTDDRIRANQVISVALPNRPFKGLVMSGKDGEPVNVEKSVVNTVQDKLLTPYGLRSLAKGEDGYAPYYPNNCSPQDRDAVYHRGTVWGWLIGPFSDAYLNVNSSSKENAEQAKKDVYGFVKPMIDQMKGNVAEQADSGACIGGISEIFDATDPYIAKGAVNQAWTVAETLRIMSKVKDVAVNKNDHISNNTVVS